MRSNITDESRVRNQGRKVEDVGVMKDEESKIEKMEDCHTRWSVITTGPVFMRE